VTPVEDDWFNCQKCGRAFYVATGSQYMAVRMCSIRCLWDDVRERPTMPDIPPEEYDRAFPPQSRELPTAEQVAAAFEVAGEPDPFKGA
jgi:hypothetical protein